MPRIVMVVAVSLVMPFAWAAEPHLAPRPLGTDTMTFGPFTYDAGGNIRTIGRGTLGQEVYTYDLMSRLHTATADVSNSQTYDYDAFGNRTTVSRTGSLCTGGSACEQQGLYTPGTNHLSNNGAAYDAAGNLIAYAADKYAYDAVGMLSRSVVATQYSQYLYTADDERIAVYDGSFNWRWTVRGADAKVLREFASTNSGSALGVGNRQWKRDYVWRDGQLLATENGTSLGEQTYHYHLDHLGTPRLLTTGTGARVSTHTYHAFGAELQTGTVETPETAMKFTGHERDVTGTADALDDMHARYYTSLQGRFLSIDPARDSDPHAPQSWNMYAYVRNSPLGRTDPTGKWEKVDHDALLQAAFPGLSNGELGVLQAASELADNPFMGGQLSSRSPEHSMTANFQTEHESEVASGKFYDEKIQKAREFNALSKKSAGDGTGKSEAFKSAALSQIGGAMHMVADDVSPQHQGRQRWSLLLHPFKAAAHIKNERAPTPSEAALVVLRLRAVYGSVFGDEELKRAITKP
jgi:RHS repeat-associated protein